MSESIPPACPPAKASPRNSLIEMALIICLAASAGGAFEALHPTASPAVEKAAESPANAASTAPTSTVVDLPPIVTNLGAPQDTWVRFEGSIVFDSKSLPHPEAVAAEIGEDALAYLRTISLHELEGPIGLENIRQDLNERAATRSGGKVRAFVIKTLVVQ